MIDNYRNYGSNSGESEVSTTLGIPKVRAPNQFLQLLVNVEVKVEINNYSS